MSDKEIFQPTKYTFSTFVEQQKQQNLPRLLFLI